MKNFVYRFTRNRGSDVGLFILLVTFLIAVLGPLIYKVSPWDMVGLPLQWPTWAGDAPLGTDALGRDLLAGMIHGAGVTLVVGFVATIIAIMVGLIIGGAAGYYGGVVDASLMRITELFQTIPAFLLCIVLVVVLRPQLDTVIIAIGISSWPPLARLVRSEILSIKTLDYVAAERLLGASGLRLIVKEILPNALAPVIVVGALTVALAIVTEAGLAFLGLSDPNVMTWGVILGGGRTVITTAWYIAAIPGLAITLVVIAINLLSDGLNDALNPRII